jgi:hypothetical protein
MRVGWNAIALACALAFSATARAQPVVVSAMEDVFPRGDMVRGAGEARVEAAAGEWESFQIVVRGPAHEVRAEASPVGPAPAPRLARVGYLQVTTPSSIEGHPGPWPDPLIPDVDAFTGERRRAFPFDVPAGEQRAIWVDLFVPHGAAAGTYHGDVRLRSRDASFRVPVTLTVHRFELPRTSSLAVTWGISASSIARAHHREDPALLHRYALAALRDRVSLFGGTFDPPLDDFRAYDAEVGPFLDGKADPGGPADGARWTAVDVRLPDKLTGPARHAYLRRLVDHLRTRGWLDRAFVYVMDEPSEAQLPEARRRAAELAREAPELPRLLTRVWDRSLAGVINRFTPVLNFVDDKPDNSTPPPRSRYTTLWWYQSCMSHGCDDRTAHAAGVERYFTDWPSLVVDAPPAGQRIQPWLSWRYRVSGELYYDTVEAYASGLDPWRDQLLHGGNGDGTLFYPGTPEAIGGKTDVPVESIRLKRVRDGLEDYEYLRLHEQRYGREATDAIARPIAERTYKWEHDVARLAAARHKLAEALDDASLHSIR